MASVDIQRKEALEERIQVRPCSGCGPVVGVALISCCAAG